MFIVTNFREKTAIKIITDVSWILHNFFLAVLFIKCQFEGGTSCELVTYEIKINFDSVNCLCMNMNDMFIFCLRLRQSNDKINQMASQQIHFVFLLKELVYDGHNNNPMWLYVFESGNERSSLFDRLLLIVARIYIIRTSIHSSSPILRAHWHICSFMTGSFIAA